MLSEMKLRGAWRKVRSKIGIRSDRMAIRTQKPWYVQLAWYGLILGVAGAVAWYLIDNQYRITGFNRAEATAEIARLKEENARLTREFALNKTLLNEREGQLKVEKASLEEFTRNLAQLQEENNGLKEDLGFLRNIMSSGSVPDGLAITNLKVEPDVTPGEYRYRVLLTQGGQRKTDFKGKLQVIARFQAQGAANAPQQALSFPNDAEVKTTAPMIEFRFYQKADGRFRIPEGMTLKSVQVRLLAAPNFEMRAQKNLNL
ncbi:MAG: hypothetical protein JNJ55_14440 [Betaproteobacteria bacterium]|nr:hypothetical protein [Betaproteobacteria bacterium]